MAATDTTIESNIVNAITACINRILTGFLVFAFSMLNSLRYTVHSVWSSQSQLIARLFACLMRPQPKHAWQSSLARVCVWLGVKRVAKHMHVIVYNSLGISIVYALVGLYNYWWQRTEAAGL